MGKCKDEVGRGNVGRGEVGDRWVRWVRVRLG